MRAADARGLGNRESRIRSNAASRSTGSGSPYPDGPWPYVTTAVKSLKLDIPSAATSPARTVTWIGPFCGTASLSRTVARRRSYDTLRDLHPVAEDDRPPPLHPRGEAVEADLAGRGGVEGLVEAEEDRGDRLPRMRDRDDSRDARRRRVKSADTPPDSIGEPEVAVGADRQVAWGICEWPGERELGEGARRRDPADRGAGPGEPEVAVGADRQVDGVACREREPGEAPAGVIRPIARRCPSGRDVGEPEVAVGADRQACRAVILNAIDGARPDESGPIVTSGNQRLPSGPTVSGPEACQ